MSAIARARAHERACNWGREWAGTVDTGKTSPQRARKTSCRCGTRACVCTEKVRANHLVEQHNVVVLNQLQQHGEALALAVVAINQEAPAEIHPRGQKAPARPRRATISSQLHQNGTRCEPLRRCGTLAVGKRGQHMLSARMRSFVDSAMARAGGAAAGVLSWPSVTPPCPSLAHIAGFQLGRSDLPKDSEQST